MLPCLGQLKTDKQHKKQQKINRNNSQQKMTETNQSALTIINNDSISINNVTSLSNHELPEAVNTSNGHSSSNSGNSADGNDNASDKTITKPESLAVSKRLSSKLILHNMEEVLHIVKKQHREKHRRKKEQKKQFLLVADDKTTLHNGCNTRNTDNSDDYSRKHKLYRKHGRVHLDKHPTLPSAATAAGACESPHEIVLINKGCDDDNSADCLDKPETPRITNAFEIMMGVRNNSKTYSPAPTPTSEISCSDSPFHVIVNSLKDGQINSSARKPKLQEWLGKKRTIKRCLEDEMRSPHVEKQLEQQSTKRFKKMLANGKNSRNSKKKQLDIDGEVCKENNDNHNHMLRKDCEKLTPHLPASKSLQSHETNGHGVASSDVKPPDNFRLDRTDSSENNDEANNCQDATANDKPKAKAKRHANSSGALGLENNVEISSIGRPKRSCANNILSYDYGLKRSPRKLKTVQKSINIENPASGNAGGIEIIDLDSSGCDERTPTSSPKKLAPLFMRPLPKPCPDQAVLEARKAFLLSGVPERIQFKRMKQKQQDIYYDNVKMKFPNISHVQQFSESITQFLNAIRQNTQHTYKLQPEDTSLNVSLPTKSTTKSKSRINKRRFPPLKLSDCSKSDFKKASASSSAVSKSDLNIPLLAKIPNKRDVVKIWKSEFGQFPTYKCYNILRDKYRHYSHNEVIQNPEQITEAFVMTQSTHLLSLTAQTEIETDPPANAPNGEQLFSEKYKPMLFEQVLVNLNPIMQLKEFLSNWTNDAPRSSHSHSNSNDSEEDSSSNQSCYHLTNAVVLLGPISSGKTNSVFTLANDMNFNVLEINAGMKRTGKRIIQELQEATLSHQIRKNIKPHNKGSLHHLKNTHQSQRKNSKTHIHSKYSRTSMDSNDTSAMTATAWESSFSSITKLNQNGLKSLILIEDADIVFEQMDAGYIDAIYTLASTSKRPVIVVATDPNSVHLQRLIAQKVIQFFAPNAENISKFLAILSLIENCPISQDDLHNLYLYNQRDLRRTLLELQFFIQSGGDLDRHSPTPTARHSIKQKQPAKQSASVSTAPDVYMHSTLYRFCTSVGQSKYGLTMPLNFDLLQVNLFRLYQASGKLKRIPAAVSSESTNRTQTHKRKSRSPRKQCMNHAAVALECLCSFYENLSLAVLLAHNHSHPATDVVDGLVPHIEQYLAQTLIEKSIEVHLQADACQLNIPVIEATRYSLCKYMNLLAANSKRNCRLNYEPILRSICRSERDRAGRERRSTRFYHYLRNCMPYNEFITKECEAAVCNVFQDYDCEAQGLNAGDPPDANAKDKESATGVIDNTAGTATGACGSSNSTERK